MACYENITTLGICPDEEASTSGFTLLQAAGMSPKIFANIANENYTSGADLAMEKKALTLNQVRNDFIGALQMNNVMTQMAKPVYDSSRFNTGAIIQTYAGERGITIHKTGSRGGLRKRKIKNIQLFPLDNGDTTIIIYDGYTETQFAVTVVAGEINTFEADYTIQSQYARVLVDQTNIRFASTPIICLKGCGGKIPNDCAWVDGWDGTAVTRNEGYGINVQFYCECDYDEIMCDVKYMGEIIWLKWQINVFDEQYKTNRFNNWVTYNRDTIPDVIAQLKTEYTEKWNEMMAGLFGLLKQYRDECLDCRKIRWVTNV